jgi:putative ABC transport system permease protein
MWFISLRDLVYRRRRFVIAIVGTAAVFAMALVLAGMAAGFRVEAERTQAGIGADAWVVPTGVPGPWTSFRTMPAALAAAVAKEPGVRAASPLIHLRQSVHQGSKLVDVNVFGHVIGGLGEPPAAEGALEDGPGQVLVDSKLGAHIGDRIVIGRWTYRVTGLVHGMTATSGIPTVWMPLQDAQTMGFGGQPFTTAIITRGVPREVPAGLVVVSNDAAIEDSLRPLQSGIGGGGARVRGARSRPRAAAGAPVPTDDRHPVERVRAAAGRGARGRPPGQLGRSSQGHHGRPGARVRGELTWPTSR